MMNIRFSFLSFAVGLALPLPLWAQESLNGQWDFHYAANERVADSLAATPYWQSLVTAGAEPVAQGDGWQPTTVPSCWAILGYEEPVYREFKNAPHSEGFYVRRFTLPASYKGRRVSLHFGGVWASAEVWLNGVRLGRHDSGYTSFSLPAMGAAKAGAENVLAVRVRQVYPGYECDTYDDWSLGGIYRDVTLTSTPSVLWLDKLTATTDFDEHYRDADLRLGLMVYDNHKTGLPGNYRAVGAPYQLRYRLADAEGHTVFDETKVVEGHPGNGRQYDETFHVTAPKQWTAETPNLYTLTVDLVENGVVTQTMAKRIGFREVSTEGGVFRINGHAVKLRGVNRHDEWPDVGRATRKEHWLKDLQLMKEANINYVRACHYQHAKGFIEACDSIGMYVGAEVSLGGAGKLMQNSQFVGGMMLRIAETVGRDQCNPSIVYWSVGNEDTFNQMYYDAARYVKATDPTRPLLYPWCADLRLPKDIDILAPHYWTSYEYDSLCAASNRPIITTEYVHAYGTQRFGGLADCWKALHDSPRGAGGAVWMWADQGIVTPRKWTAPKYRTLSGGNEYLRISSDGWDGITDSYRQPTRDYYEVKNVYCPVYPTVDSLDALSGDRISTVSIPIHNDYDFITTRDIDIIYNVYVDDKLKRQGTTRLDIAPHADGTLPLEAHVKMGKGQTAYAQIFFKRDGKEIGRKSVVLGSRPLAAKALKGNSTFAFKEGFPVGMRPTIWHKPNEGDHIVRGKIDGEKYKLQTLSTHREELPDGYRITTEAQCIVNDSNAFRGTYTFTVNESEGSMKVDYAITPSLTSGRYTPLVGMAIKARPVRWFGLGEHEAYPNKRASEIVGVWDARRLEGTRAADWVELDNGQALRVTFTNEGAPYYGTGAHGYIDRDTADAEELRLCSHILGRSEKGRLKDRHYRLEPKGITYHGSFVMHKL